MRAARTPPDPAPMTKRSTSRSAIHLIQSAGADRPRLDFVTASFHFGAHLVDDLCRELLCPTRRRSHALVRDHGLFNKQLVAEWRFIKGDCVLELLLREANSI